MTSRTDPRFGPSVIKAEIGDRNHRREGYLLNVSAGGAFLAMSDPPLVGTETHLTASLPWKLGVLRARVRVVWRKAPSGPSSSNASTTGAGLLFTTMDDAAQRILRDYVARFEKLVAELEESSIE